MGRPHWLLPEAPYESFAAYRADCGGSAVERARGMTAEQVIDEVDEKVRGTAGVPPREAATRPSSGFDVEETAIGRPTGRGPGYASVGERT